MFDNIGGKIKDQARSSCYLGIVISMLLGAMLLLSGQGILMILGLLIAVAGSLVSWQSSFVLYGFGEMVENSDILAGRIQGKEPKAAAPSGQNAGGTQKKAKVTGPIPRDAVIFPTRTEAEIECPKCGFAQIGYRDLCRSCKVPFFYKDEIE